MIAHPHRRPRRLRRTPGIRGLVEDIKLTAVDLVYPIFVTENAIGVEPEPIKSLPGQFRFPLQSLGAKVKTLSALGLRGVMLFPVNNPARKDRFGTYALDPHGLACQALRAIKSACPDLIVFADVALDPYTDHGHDGITDAQGRVLNDETVDALIGQSLVLASAGADFLCPSDMMDGRVGAIREALDRDTKQNVGILSYCAKFASAYYGPFRDAVGQTIRGLDKSEYQLSPSSSREAWTECELDIAEGADVIMVKPAGPYLDVVKGIRERTNLPLAVYQVSGEYSMIRAAALNGWLDERAIVLESLVGCKRAGADIIATYFAEDVLHYLSDI
jgi:porphobilinogen synthase